MCVSQSPAKFEQEFRDKGLILLCHKLFSASAPWTAGQSADQGAGGEEVLAGAGAWVMPFRPWRGRLVGGNPRVTQPLGERPEALEGKASRAPRRGRRRPRCKERRGDGTPSIHDPRSGRVQVPVSSLRSPAPPAIATSPSDRSPSICVKAISHFVWNVTSFGTPASSRRSLDLAHDSGRYKR